MAAETTMQGPQVRCYATFVHLPYKFTGKERDAESSLDYFGARHYASTMGRFMTADQAADETIPVPLPWADFRNPQSLNLYSYALKNGDRRDEPHYLMIRQLR